MSFKERITEVVVPLNWKWHLSIRNCLSLVLKCCPYETEDAYDKMPYYTREVPGSNLGRRTG